MNAPEVPLTSMSTLDATPSDHGDGTEAARLAAAGGYFGGARLLFADARVVYLLLNEARSRTIARLFGISGENSALVTLIALGLAAHTVRSKVGRVLNAPGVPDAGDAVIGASLMRESVRGIAGAWSRDSPIFGTLVIASLVGTVVRPVVRATVHGVKASAHVARADFDHRYGHIIRPNRSQH
jgi:hypothetical protein